MRNDPKIRAVRAKFGLEGYAVWCLLLETLGDSDGFIMDWDMLSIEICSGDFGISSEQLVAITDYLQRLNLIQIEGEKLQCYKLSDRLTPLIEKRERMQERYKSQFLPQKKAETGVSAAETPQSRVEKSRVEKSRVEKSRVEKKEESIYKGASADFSFESEKNNSDQPEEGKNKKPSPVPAAPSLPSDLVREWCKDNLLDLRKWADEESFTAAHGTVKNQVQEFCNWYGEKAKADLRERYLKDPVKFFRGSFQIWLRRAVKQQGQSVGRKPTKPTSTAFRPKTEPEILSTFRARYGSEIAERLTRQNLDKLMQADNLEDFENWSIGFYERLKKSAPAAPVVRGSSGAVSLGSLITKPA